MSVIRVALIGAGRAGLVHGRNFAAGIRGARLVAVADPSAAARESAVRELGEVRAFEHARDAATDDGVDAVVIAGPTFMHADVAIAALDAGKHVLCEKPIASSLEDALAIRAAVNRARGSFVMGFMRRSDAGFARLAERLQAGDVGVPLYVRSTGRGPGLPPPWALDPAVSGGLIAEVGSHDIDTVRWLSGQEPTRVFAVGRASKRPDLARQYPGFVDLLAVTIELSGGALGQIDNACPADYGYDARVEVYGTEGVLLAGRTSRDAPVLVRADGVVSDPIASWRTLFADAYREEDRRFIATCLGIEAPLATVDDGIAALRVVIGVNRSIQTGAPIDLDQVVVE